MKELILGGVKSGKSRLAEQRAAASGLQVVYIATAEARDEGMRERIERHRARRPADWLSVEAPYELAAALASNAREDRCLLIDCLTLWLTQLLCLDNLQTFQYERDRLLDILPELPGHLIFVSNETSMGIMPVNDLARRFADEAGILHQEIAYLSQRVTLMSAGLPLTLKDHIDEKPA